jgi:GT2 family glycosyltransferase
MSHPAIAIVLLNWNQTELTLACLRSLARLDYPAAEIILVDNGSAEDSLEPIESEFPGLVLIRNERNLGFTGGNNVGICRALADGSDYIMLLNNDTEVAPDMLRVLVDVAESDPSIGIVGPLILYYDEPTRIWSAGGAVDPRTAGAVSLGEGEPDDGDLPPTPVDYVSGCALLIKRAVVERVGLLDERMFIYYEEADWCARAREAGYQIQLVPRAKVWHKISMQTRAVSRRYIYLMTRNRLLYLRNRSKSIPHILGIILLQDVRQVILWQLRPRYRDRRPMVIYKARGVVDYMRGRFGEPPFPP